MRSKYHDLFKRERELDEAERKRDERVEKSNHSEKESEGMFGSKEYSQLDEEADDAWEDRNPWAI